ncbi:MULTISPECIES: DUF6918 family protein [Corynebacterium]|uniref:Uncharacterized protein n=1 Tax=Corynebacterium coyleae TaxID=53374 RepID=A0AAP6XMV3_9CORY|nr:MULTISPECIES: hypothetical protein [Corynebacterium]MDK6492708.1 hypothetical protein [Corynebacterium coyleae]MDK8241818.1 hypothetical protein [Corynebacterium coyleae]MDK8663476.1 hypothetical protein [Corynebacterium coyleae]MDK8706906.1 hypothetical protein [Corynebacterium coyleae]MDK8733753.1 hypothetical protein [Corynebacterium coyleae]
MSDLSKLLDASTRSKLVEDLTQLTETTVANQSGLTGMALKSAIAAGKKADADAVSKGLNKFLPDLVESLNPHWNAFKASGQQDFGGFLAANEDSVIDSVLKAGDTAIESMPSALKKVYSTLRGKAKKIVSPALPDLGRVVEKYA